MKRTPIIILIFLLFNIEILANNIKEIRNILTPQDVVNIEKGILKDAIKLNNFDDVTTIALSFLATSKNPSYLGDKESLNKKALLLLQQASMKGNIKASMFLMLNKMATEPLKAREVAKRVILKNLDKPNSEYLFYSKTFVTSFVALTLDHFQTDEKELHLALEALESLKMDIPQVNLYRAFLLKALKLDKLADTYLNKACRNAKSKKIITFCSSLEI